MKYEYLVVYHFRKEDGNGIGRSFIERDKAIDSSIDIEGIEKYIAENSEFEFKGVMVTDFKLLKVSDGSVDKTDALYNEAMDAMKKYS